MAINLVVRNVDEETLRFATSTSRTPQLLPSPFQPGGAIHEIG